MIASIEFDQPYSEAEQEFRETHALRTEGEGAVWTDVLTHLRRAAIQARMAPGNDYKRLLSDTARFLERLADVLGSKGNDQQTVYSVERLWDHAGDRQIHGWERCKVDWPSLMELYIKYKQQPLWQTPYLDWVFLDAFMYLVLYKLIDDIHNDLLKPGDMGRFLPPLQRAYANSSDQEKAHPHLLEIQRALQLAAFRWLPTILVLGIGVGCFYWIPWFFSRHRNHLVIGAGWALAGWTILSLLAIRRIYRLVRWFARIGLRRRAWRVVNRLEDGYTLLSARAIPTRELHRVIDDVSSLMERSSFLGGDFWAVLDDVCARHPATLVPRAPLT